MKTLHLILISLLWISLIFISKQLSAQVAVNETGLQPNSKSMLDISSESKGLLTPRMTTTQRTTFASTLGIAEKGMIVFDTNDLKYYFWDGTSFMEINSGNIDKLLDSNGDSKIELTTNSGNDVAEITLEDTIYFRFRKRNFETRNSGHSIFIGQHVGEKDDLNNNKNVFIGDYSGYVNASGNDNLGIGYTSLHENTTGNNNISLGNGSLYLNESGEKNVSLGVSSLFHNISGSQNFSVGYVSSYNNTTGSDNVNLGYQTNYFNQTGSGNTILGSQAGLGSDYQSKSGSVFIGFRAGYYENQSNKLYIENSASSTPLIGGDFSTNQVDINGNIKITGGNPGKGKYLSSDTVGYATWDSINLSEIHNVIEDNSNLYIGASAGTSDVGDNSNVGIGRKACNQNQTGGNNVAVGILALYSNATGSNNTALGAQTLSVSSSIQCTAIGAWSLHKNSGNNNVAIGYSAANTHMDGDGNINIGSFSGYHHETGSHNTMIGFSSGFGSSSYSASGNVFIGYTSGFNETGSNKLYIENSSSASPLIGGDFSLDEVYINGTIKITGGNPANGKILTCDSLGNATWENNSGASELNELSDVKFDGSSLFVGNLAGESDDGANNNVAMGSEALTANTSGKRNSAMGSKALYTNNNDDNTAVGFEALYTNSSGNKNTSIGSQALYGNSSGSNNVAMGYHALNQNTTGYKNTGAGVETLIETTSGHQNVAIGTSAGSIGNNNNCTYIGVNAKNLDSSNYLNSTAIGFQTTLTASNQVRIGNSTVNSIGGYADWTNVSDQRFKSDIKEDVTGLAFILKLRPVSYNLDINKINNFLGKESQSGSKNIERQTGFIAQEVEEVANELGFEFSGIDKPDNNDDYYGLRYAQFVVPLVKAVQEQQQAIATLEQKLENTEKENSALKSRMDKLEEMMEKRINK